MLSTFTVRTLLVVVASLLLYGFLSVRVISLGSSRDAVTVYAYCDMLSSEDFDAFTKATGIEVVVRHFETVEEVMTKLVFTQDSEIDIVAPTDAMLEVLVKQNLLQPLQHDKLPSLPELEPFLMGRFYDPTNSYSVPFSWTPIGIGYNKRMVNIAPEDIGWDFIFEKRGHNVCLGDDPIESIFLVMLYKYGRILQTLSPEQQEEITAILRQQRAWVECYSNNLRYFLVSDVCAAVVIPSAYMMHSCGKDSAFDFVIPKVGTVMFVGNLGISSRSTKVDKAHAVIEFLISRAGSGMCFNKHSFLPANASAAQDLPERIKAHKSLFPQGASVSQLYTLHNEIPLKTLQQMWHNVIV